VIEKWAWQIRSIVALYSSVKRLIVLYVLSVLFGMVLEGLALAAIVPLVGGGGGIADRYFDVLDTLGLPANETGLVGLIATLFVARSVAQYSSALLGGLVIRREAVRLQVELFDLYLGLSWDEVVKRDRGEINLLLSTQTQDVATFMYRCITLLEGVVYAIGLTAVAVVISPSNTLLAVGLIGLSLLGVGLISSSVQRHAQSILSSTQEQANRLLEYAGNASLIRAYGVGDSALADIRERAEQRERVAFRSQRVEALGWVLPDLLFVLALLSVVGLAYRAGDDFAQIGAIIALLYRVSQYLKRFADFSSVSAALPTIRAVHRLRQVFRENQARGVSAVNDPELATGTVLVQDVSFQFSGAAEPALSGISFRIEPGEFVGIVGPSGAGKSTLAQLIVGLLSPQEGTIRIGGDRSATAYVPQTPTLISGTLAHNVSWLRDIPDDEIESSCREAGLGAVIDRLPDGIHSHVAQDGASLSGGERQRVALARALVGLPRVLVLDEATSALDAVSEVAVQQVVNRMRGDVTVVAVAHRLSTVLAADRILVVDGGRVVETGTPKHLLEDPDSLFSRLAMMQGILR
jgi:ATP-binding cassette, subfamily B, bacterial